MFGGNSGSGDATGNAVTLTGGTFTGNIYGAFAMYNATGNTVTIEAGATLDAGVTLYGGSSAMSGDAVTGNILNLKKSGVTISRLGNFAKYNFTLPASIAAGSTVITASGGYDGTSAIDITDITVGLALDGTPSLVVGNKITLIDGGAYGVTGTPATTSLTASGYTFGIAVESDKLVATVTAAPGDPLVERRLQAARWWTSPRSAPPPARSPAPAGPGPPPTACSPFRTART
ncbi:MAG: hypothetical protein LBK99_13690 [Opitutaceae bacterium]|jgi:hypothetical protein|nr:hypothetical protein [Opitutaceae bacterium]